MASTGYLPPLFWPLLAILYVVLPVSGDYCRRGTYYTSYFYCPESCCGYYSKQYCCDDVFLGGGAIAGIVIGSLVGLAMLITLLVCICAACNKTTSGRVVQPINRTQASVAVVSTNTYTGSEMVHPPRQAYPPPGQAYPPQGQAYPPQGQAYPAHGQAYPPPPPVYHAQESAYPPPNPGHGVPPPKYSAY